MTQYGVAIVGCGWIGLGAQADPLRIAPASHAQAAASCPRTRLAAFVDADVAALARAARWYPGVPCFTDMDAMLVDGHPDIIIIATPPETHSALVVRAAGARVRAILCEKPIAHALEEARAAVRACAERGALLFVHHTRRFDPYIRRFRDNLRGGYVQDSVIGAVRSAIAYYDKGLYHGGTHFIDLLRFFLGDVRWVSAVPNTAFPRVGRDVCVDAFMGFPEATAALQYFDSGTYCLFEMSLFGERGRLNLKHMAGLEIEVVGTRSCDEFSNFRELDDRASKRFGAKRSMLASVLPHIVDCLEGRDIPVSTGEDALRTLEVIAAMERSVAQDGRRVELHS